MSSEANKLERPRKRRLPPHASLALEFCTNPKVERAGLAAAGLYCLMLSYCALNKTDGAVPKSWAHKTGGAKVAQKLIDVELVRLVGDDYLIPDYLDFNYSRAEIAEVSAYTRQLAERRWNMDESEVARTPSANRCQTQCVTHMRHA